MITKTKQRIRLSKKAKKAIAVLLWPAINALSVWVFTSLAYMERGYKAIGGEWLLIIAIAAGSTKIVIDVFKEDK